MGLENDQVRQLKQLAEENQRLKRLVADAGQDDAAGSAGASVPAPAQRRRAHQNNPPLGENRS